MTVEVDGHKLGYHPERVAEWFRTGDCFPIYVEVGPTNRCNHRCMFCALDWLKKGGSDIDKDVLARNLEDMASHGVKSVMFAGEGEPLCHQDLPEFVQTAKSNSIDVSITTNGALLSRERAEGIIPHLSWIRFSVDAGQPKTYARVHGCGEKDFHKVLRNIAYAVQLKRENNYAITIGVQALLIKDNAAELVELARRVKDIGVDNIQIKPYSHHPSSKNDLTFGNAADTVRIREVLEGMASTEFQVAYRSKTMGRVEGAREYSECLGLPFFALVDSEGGVIPCNLFYNDPNFVYGNINSELFSEIWFGEARKQVLRRLRERSTDSCRKGCRLDFINQYLNRLRKPEPHDNFI